MKRQKVVAFKNLPARLPLMQTVVVWLLLDRIHAAGWIWGVVGTLMTAAWIASVIGVFNQEQTEIL